MSGRQVLEHFGRRVPCPDAGVESCGYGQVMVEIGAWPRKEVEAWQNQ